ncbi:siderophore-interacting protein [Streptomyces sp. NPDC005728]|uniref:siderophore-interacting protein n=1 Tax=Streptomyces sp. NPDC005728 TaxID=3157054 RepID=UPI0033E84C3F
MRIGLRELARAYTLSDVDPSAGWVEGIVLDHPGNGPGARWAREARTGDRGRFTRPEGGLVHHAGTRLLLVGDETSVPGFAAITSRPPMTEAVTVLVEVDSLDDELSMPEHVDVSWLPRPRPVLGGLASRATPPPIPGAPLLEPMYGLELPESGGSAHLTGEARTIPAVRAHLIRERGWSRRSITTKPYWTPGKTGLD